WPPGHPQSNRVERVNVFGPRQRAWTGTGGGHAGECGSTGRRIFAGSAGEPDRLLAVSRPPGSLEPGSSRTPTGERILLVRAAGVDSRPPEEGGGVSSSAGDCSMES